MKTDIGKLFLTLNHTERKEVTSMLVDVGLCIEFKTDFRKIICQHKANSKGKLLKLYIRIFDMSKAELDRVAGLIIKHK